MVRARAKQHLQNLLDNFPHIFKGTTINETKDTDYAYRIFITKTQWVDCLVDLGDRIDYSNFKGRCQSQKCLDTHYNHALHSVWSVMHRLQPAGVGLYAQWHHPEDNRARVTVSQEPEEEELVEEEVECEDSDDGLHRFSADLEYDPSGKTITCEWCGEVGTEDDVEEEDTEDYDPLDPWGEGIGHKDPIKAPGVCAHGFELGSGECRFCDPTPKH